MRCHVCEINSLIEHHSCPLNSNAPQVVVDISVACLHMLGERLEGSGLDVHGQYSTPAVYTGSVHQQPTQVVYTNSLHR